MKIACPKTVLALGVLLFFTDPADSGPQGGPAAFRDACRYGGHRIPSLSYRQFEDSRRYNAAPCTPPAAIRASVYHRPELVRTEVICRESKTRKVIARNGERYRVTDVVVTYREVWSDGRCRIRKTTRFGSRIPPGGK